MDMESIFQASNTPSCIDDGTKKKPSRSSVWEHFTKIGSLNNLRCKCNHCGKDYACDTKRNGTSSLWHHLNGCIRYKNSLVDEKQKALSCCQTNKSGNSSNILAVGFSKEICRKACTKMIILDGLPFSFVESRRFRWFCSVACPKFDPPSRRTIARDVYQFYLDEKQSLKGLFTRG